MSILVLPYYGNSLIDIRIMLKKISQNLYILAMVEKMCNLILNRIRQNKL